MTSSDISPSLRPGGGGEGEVRKEKCVLGPHIPVK